MEETQISITVKPIYMERLLYWIIIIVLAVLLVLAYLKESKCDTTTTKGSTTVPTAPAPNNTLPAQQPAQNNTPAASCSDGLKNQDESDVDCGGRCTSCALGKSCALSADCISGICSGGKCVATAPVTLSGKVDFTLIKVNYSITNTSVKVTGISYKLVNGLSESLVDAKIDVELRSKNNVKCLNQVQDTGDCDKAFATISLDMPIQSGKTFSESPHTFTTGKGGELTSGSFVIEGSYWSIGESFNVVATLYDKDGNNLESDAVLVNT
jgi:hypothetical protein